MQIFTHRTLALTSFRLMDPVSAAADVPLYGAILQKSPFVEIQLVEPLPASRINRRRLRFNCDEVGVFKDQISRQSWTIGKHCRPL